jgi:proton glutamate symport protein
MASMARMALHWQILAGMLLGAVIGVVANGWLSVREIRLEAEQLPAGVATFISRDSVQQVEMSLETTDGDRRRWVVTPLGRDPESLPDLGRLAQEDPLAHDLFQRFGRSPARRLGEASQRLGNLFLRLLQMVAVPLIVSSLITGVLGMGKASQLGAMFLRTIAYYLLTSLLAISTGILMVRLLRPGLRGDLELAPVGEPPASESLGEILFRQVETLIPVNPIAALAEPNFLSVISFSLAFAIFALRVGGSVADHIRQLFESLFAVMMAMTSAIIRLAPLGVFFLMVYVTATQGIQVFQALFWYLLTAILALVFHALLTLPLILHFVARVSPWRFAQALSPALLTAFSSASSNGTLPLTMACVEKRAGIDNRVCSFVLPLGATINMDGTALYEAVAVLFIAELYFGVELGLTQQLLVALTALLASVGAAGIPHAGLVMMVIILQAVGLPVEMQGIILAVDRVLDMCRTSVNVWSDACGCAVVQRFAPMREVA